MEAWFRFNIESYPHAPKLNDPLFGGDIVAQICFELVIAVRSIFLNICGWFSRFSQYHTDGVPMVIEVFADDLKKGKEVLG